MRSIAACIAACIGLLGMGCQDGRSSPTGWAATVPSDAIRYVQRPVQPVAPAPASVPTVAPPVASPDAGVAPPAPAAAAPSAEPAPITRLRALPEATVTLWHSYRSGERDALKASVEAFHAYGTPTHVTLRLVPFDAFNDKIKIVVPHGRGPDLFIFAHDLVGAWSEMEIIEPLDDLTTVEDTRAFLPMTVKALLYKDSLYGLPTAFKTVALYYNKALVDHAPTTVEELITVAKRHTDGKGKFGLVYEAANLYFHGPWLLGFGGEVLDAAGRPRLRSKEAADALRFAQDLVKRYAVTPPSVTTAMVSGYFNDGSAAMVINGPWMRGEISGVRYGVAPLPDIGAGRPARPFLGVEAIFLSRRSKSKAQAFEVMRFLTSDAAARIRFEKGGQPVANAGVWAEAAKGTMDPAMAAFRAQAEHAVAMPSSATLQQVWTPYNDALLSVIAGDKDIDAALRDAQQRVERAIARMEPGG